MQKAYHTLILLLWVIGMNVTYLQNFFNNYIFIGKMNVKVVKLVFKLKSELTLSHFLLKLKTRMPPHIWTFA